MATADARTRPVYERGAGEEIPWPVVDRDSFSLNDAVIGPLIVEETTCTSVVPPGWSVSVDAHGSW